jgi:hypothetical protein
MSTPDRITVSRSKRGTTIKASGRAAQQLFDVITKQVDKGAKAAEAAPAKVARQVIAWCWATGLIEIGEELPDGAVEIVRGPAEQVHQEMEVAARHGYEGGLLVPGVPEARSQRAKGQALVVWAQWRGSRSRHGLNWNPKLLKE